MLCLLYRYTIIQSRTLQDHMRGHINLVWRSCDASKISYDYFLFSVGSSGLLLCY